MAAAASASMQAVHRDEAEEEVDEEEAEEEEGVAAAASEPPAGKAPWSALQGQAVLHEATGAFVARVSNKGLGDAEVEAWTRQCMLPQLHSFIAKGYTVRQADLDFSHNRIGDAGLRALLQAWLRTGVRCPLLVKMHFNRLTDAALGSLASFVHDYGGKLRELHLSNNCFASRQAVLDLFSSFVGPPQYPQWVRRQRRYAPVYIRLGHCGIEQPEQLLKAAEGLEVPLRLCLMRSSTCSKTSCCRTQSGDSSTCPVAHLYGFLEQDDSSPAAIGGSSSDGLGSPNVAVADCPPAGLSGTSSSSSGPWDSASAAPAAADVGTETPPQKRLRGMYLCGACGREQPLDMFGRYQFRKAAAVDQWPSGGVSDLNDGQQPEHLIRRCNDCVKQPCSACRKELPLSSFAKTQMMRPSQQRRCRECAAETILCLRCQQPKPPSSFSVVEAGKRKAVPRVCMACEHLNPYFERRHVVLLCLGSGRRFGQTRVQRLPVDALRRILELSEPGDEFTKVRQGHFQCSLCSGQWSILTNDVDRHVHASKHHRIRLERLRQGRLLRIASLDVEPARFSEGLGIRGAVCSREQVEEARRLIPLRAALAEGVTHEVLRVAGLPPNSQWVQPRVLEAAIDLQVCRRTSVPAGSSATCAEVKSAQRRWKLFGHLGAEAEGEDAEELSAVSMLLCGDLTAF